MTVQKVISKDPKKENEKYLIFLDYILDKLKNGRPAGISLRNLASDYKTEMGTIIDRQELKTFMQLYNGLYFDKVKSSIDRLKIKDETTKILLKYGSIREYLNQQKLDTSPTKQYKKSLFSRYWKFISAVVTCTLLLMGGINDWFDFRDRISPNKDASSTKQSTNSEVNQSSDSLYILETDSLSSKFE